MEKLQSGLKQKDHDLRKTIQDFDSLKFHNERLVRRVESLQGELRHKAGYTSWFGSTQHRREAEKLQQTMDLLQTDLQNKIRQNGELQAQLDELNLLHRESLENSAKDKRKLNEQIRDMKQEMVGQMSSYEDQLSHLKARLAELERRPSRTSNDPPSNERTDAAMAVEADRLKERINELERQLADAQRANGDHHVLELEDRLRKLEGELKHERDLHRQVRSELERFSFEKQQAQSKLDEELGNQADLRQPIEKLEAEGTILRERLTERDLQVKDLESKVPLPKSVMEGAAQTDPIPAPVPSVQSHTPQTVIELHLPKVLVAPRCVFYSYYDIGLDSEWG